MTAASRRFRAAVALLVVAVGLAGCGPDATPDGPATAATPDVDAAALVKAVDKGDVAKLDPVRLADGLAPPTNKWFSGLVFGAQPQPVFPLPLSFGLTTDGFQLGLPPVTTTASSIVGPFTPAVTVAAGATSARVSAYDAVSVTIELLDGHDVLGSVVLAEGSPFVSFTAARDATLHVDVPFTADGDGPARATVGDRDYGLEAPDGALASGAVDLNKGQTATWFPLPDHATDGTLKALTDAAAHPLTGTTVAYGIDQAVARTTITYESDGSTGAYTTMPHQRAGDQPDRTCGLGSYPSIYGTLQLCAGKALTTWAPTVEPSGALDLSHLDATRRDAVVAQLAKDVAGTKPFPSDTYFGGKALYRAATLVQLGHQLDADDVVKPLKAKVVAALTEWTQPKGCATRDTRCFEYDESARGVVGRTPSFGSEEFNDHHFHYGYFLGAAGILAATDKRLATTFAPVMNLLAQDVAAAKGSDEFPVLRTFDPYQGHGWASGTSPFADGNNQESSSEAVNAWNGLALWGEASGQDALTTQGTWMLSAEAASAKAYWTNPDLDDPVYQGFDHQVVSLNWGGKRDWSTWFSAEPSAMLGIQLLPLSPVGTYLAGDPGRIRANVAEAAPDGYDVTFGDYLLMYSGLAGPDDAKRAYQEAATLPDDRIDDGNSRSYLMAWLSALG
ncbi:glycosyl hydrolase [Cellulomonas sp. McL0617]|uniref:glycosyl hydrolase n=1 Tax=Cellulomonas sp. McL0617 TaxID=3415675 RepID=UPI003CEFFCFC